jgi:hypothetical protein
MKATLRIVVAACLDSKDQVDSGLWTPARPGVGRPFRYPLRIRRQRDGSTDNKSLPNAQVSGDSGIAPKKGRAFWRQYLNTLQPHVTPILVSSSRSSSGLGAAVRKAHDASTNPLCQNPPRWT